MTQKQLEPTTEQPEPTTKARQRPRQSAARPCTISIRLSGEEKACIDAAAGAAELTATGYVATAALAAATASGPASGHELRSLQHELFAVRRAVNDLAVTCVTGVTGPAGGVPQWAETVVRQCRAALARLDQVAGSVDGRLR